MSKKEVKWIQITGIVGEASKKVVRETQGQVNRPPAIKIKKAFNY